MSTLLSVALLFPTAFPVLALTQIPFSAVIHLSNISYYMHQVPVAGLEIGIQHFIEPATIFQIPSSVRPDKVWLEQQILRFLQEDDVWSEAFLRNIILHYESELDLNLNEPQEIYRDSRTSQVYHKRLEFFESVGEGPYFLHAAKVYPAYRLYPDIAGAFVVGTVPSKYPFRYKAVDASAHTGDFPTALSIPVPSRLHFPRAPDKPYAGMRIAVKDIIDLAGLKTGASSRAYTQLYDRRDTNAVIIQKLLELGFVVVGKVKTTQFADSEWPTCDWVDYHAPFNPRGDGYLTTSGSSAGSAAAVATYNWLDSALGTDTLGSIRAPATAQGIYGMRPSLGAASFDGIIPYSPKFDTVGAFSKSASGFALIARAMYGSQQTPTCKSKPSRLIYPTDYWPVENAKSQRVFETYIERLEVFLGIKRTAVNLEELWKATNPLGTNQTLKSYLEHVFEWVANPDQWNGFFKTFLTEFEDKYGHRPALNPQLQFKRDYLPTTLCPVRQGKGVEAIKVFQEWYEKHVVPPAKQSCSDTLLLLPWSNGKPDYRDRYRDSAQMFTGRGFFFYNISPYAKSPELIIPAGFTTYTSRLTGREEKLPVGLGIVSGRESDIMLAELIAEFELQTADGVNFNKNMQAFADQNRPEYIGKQASHN